MTLVAYLLDTNVVSEWVARRPDPAVVRWLDEVDEDDVFLSVVTIGELREGVDRLDSGRRRDLLDVWLSVDLPERFGGRLLPIDAAVAALWGAMRASEGRAGRTLPVADAFIVATAARHELAIVSRNVRDVSGLGVEVFNPWTGG